MTYSEEEWARIKARAEHVIVLMLENRSFDQLFGFLDHPNPDFDPERLHVGDHLNPYDLAVPDVAVGVTDDGDPRLELDPPHGHASALKQMNRVERLFRMDGFVAAYADKIAGRERRPRIMWRRLGELLGAVVVAVLGPAAYDLARLGVNGGWRAMAPWAVVGAVLAVGLTFTVLGADVPGFKRRRIATYAAIAGLVVAFAVQGWIEGVDDPGRFVVWPVAVLAGSEWMLWSAWKRSTKQRTVPLARVRQESARIMRCMKEEHLPALAQLAKEFCVCTRWFSSVPGATWPNRNFVHAATSADATDIEIGFYTDETVFERLEQADRSWRVYHEGTAQVIAFKKLWLEHSDTHYRPLDHLVADIAANDLPAYTFVEPCHSGDRSNSQHPGNNEDRSSEDFLRGDQLVASIYNALVANPALFETTTLVITYDEHGGCFDHVPPPPVHHPDDKRTARRRREFWRRFVALFVQHQNQAFAFTHLGPRVPAVVVSPFVYQSIDGGDDGDGRRIGVVDGRTYEHASVPASLLRMWAPTPGWLTRRDREAEDFLHLLAHDRPAVAARRCDAYDDGARARDFARRPLPVDAPLVVGAVPPPLAREGDDLVDQLDSVRVLVEADAEAGAALVQRLTE